jgi:hypothetical protein
MITQSDTAHWQQFINSDAESKTMIAKNHTEKCGAKSIKTLQRID